MLHLSIIILTTIALLLIVQVYAKWQIRKLTKKTFCLQEEALQKESRIKKIEELTLNKLSTMSYSEQITRFISDGIIVATREKILYANPAMTKLTGYTSEELINKSWLNFVIREDQEATIATITTDLDTISEIDGVYHFINRWKTKTGEKIALWWSMTPFDEDGICYGICRDVTRQNGRKEKIDFLLKKLLGIEYDETENHALSNGHDTATEKVDNE